jgi:phosphoenolpyruvate-protein phosphotransferase (PTS system enzyme I)
MAERVVTVGSRTGLHARPAALFVKAAAAQPVRVKIRKAGGGKAVDARSMLGVLALGAEFGTEVTLTAEGDEAEAALAVLADLIARDLDAEGEDGGPAAGAAPAATAVAAGAGAAAAGVAVAEQDGGAPADVAAEPAAAAAAGVAVAGQDGGAPADTAAAGAGPAAGGELRGRGVSAGVAVGPALRMGAPPALGPPVAVTDAAAETARATAAMAAVAADLEQRGAAAHDPAGQAVLAAQAMMAADPGLADGVESRIGAGQDAGHAVQAAFAEFRESLLATGGYLAERAADLADVRDRVLASILGMPMPGLPDPGHPYVLLAEDLAPADTVALDPAVVLGLVTVGGGPTSHTAILARSMGLPAVVGCAGALSVADGTLVRVDGRTGRVEIGVDAPVGVRATAPAGGAGPGRTADGHPVDLLLNVGAAGSLSTLDGAAGVGLFRTEFLYLGRTDPPSTAEQQRSYAELFTAAGTGKVVVRTLDAGADKPLPFLQLAGEPNPALGVRGLRVARRRPEVLDGQLEAVAAAAGGTAADVWVMAPMVATAAEAADFVRRARGHGLTTVGVMIEIPAAALLADRLLAVTDFLSIGTNDLSQYLYAADRESGELGDLLDPWQPALLRLIATCGAAGTAAGKPVGVCGEAASDPLLGCVLVGLGVTSLSMSARAVPGVRAELARHTRADCERFAALALDAPDADAARGAVEAAAGAG